MVDLDSKHAIFLVRCLRLIALSILNGNQRYFNDTIKQFFEPIPLQCNGLPFFRVKSV